MPRLYSVEGKGAEKTVLVDTAKGFVLLVSPDIQQRVFRQIILYLAAPLLTLLKDGMPISLKCSSEIFKLCAKPVITSKRKPKTRKDGKRKHKCPTLDEAFGCPKCNPGVCDAKSKN